MAVNLKPLNEQTIVITGASSGIGLATAEAAVEQGARVVIAARSKGDLDEIAQRLGARGGQVLAVECDVADKSQVERLAQEAVGRFGQFDTWVNNAGVGIYGRLEQIQENDARKMFDTNFFGLWHGSVVALQYLRRTGGALINIGSEASESASPILGMYVASKHAVKGLTDSLRVEVEEIDKAPVSITLIEPPGIDTPFAEHSRNYMENEAALPGKLLDPKQVADEILDAAVNPTRKTKIGMKTKVETFVSNNFPGVADKFSAKQGEQLKGDAPARNREGALHEPGGGGRTHGNTPKGAH